MRPAKAGLFLSKIFGPARESLPELLNLTQKKFNPDFLIQNIVVIFT